MIRRNLVANYSGTLVVAIAQVVTIPLYVQHLGEHNWGVLSSLLALAATLLILEAGVSQAVARSIAEEGRSTGGIRRTSFIPVERRYLATIAIVSSALALSSLPLGQLLFKNAGDAKTLLALIAIAMAASQILGSLYRGALIGYGAQIRFNLLLVASTIVRHGVGVFLAATGQEVTVVCGALAFGFAAETSLRRAMLMPLLSKRATEASIGPLQSTISSSEPNPGGARGGLLLALAGVGGALPTQLDRLILSAKVNSVELGHYAIAATLSLALLQLVYPASNALMPHINRFKSAEQASPVMPKSYLLLVALLIAAWLFSSIFLTLGLNAWLPDTTTLSTTSAISTLFLLHLIGTTLNALCIPLHLRLLADHRDRSILGASMGSVGVLLVTILLLIPSYGIYAGSLAWIACNTALLLTYTLISRSPPHS